MNSMISMASAVELVGILVLFCLLILKELAIVSEDENLLHLGKAINLAIVPLMIVFILVVLKQVINTI